MEQVDYRFEDHGSIWLCEPLTGCAKEIIWTRVAAVSFTFVVGQCLGR